MFLNVQLFRVGLLSDWFIIAPPWLDELFVNLQAVRVGLLV